MREKGSFLQICFTIGAIFIIFLIVGGASYYNQKLQNNDCLTQIAKEYCENKGLEYFGVGWTFTSEFYCKEDLRMDVSKDYNFLEEDFKRCEEDLE